MRKLTIMEYTDQQINEFLELAQEIGIGRAKRKLKYPGSWATAQRWAEMRGVEVDVDTIMQRRKLKGLHMQTDDLLLVAEEGISRVAEELDNTFLDPDGHKKLSEAFQKYVNSWRLLQEKATSIANTYERTQQDLEIEELIRQHEHSQSAADNKRSVNQGISEGE